MRNRKVRIFLRIVLPGTLLASFAVSGRADVVGFTISQGNATFKLGDFPNMVDPTAINQISASDLKFGSFDPLRMTVWFVRFGNQTREYTIPSYSSKTVTKSSASVSYATTDYDITLSYAVADRGKGAGLSEVLSLRNLTNQAVPVSIFNYAEFINLDSASGSLTSKPPKTKDTAMTFSGKAGSVVYEDDNVFDDNPAWTFFGSYSNQWRAGVATADGFTLTDNNKTTWDMTKLPDNFNNNTIGAGFEYDKMLEKMGTGGGQASIVAAATILTTVTPEPSYMVLLAAAFVAMLALGSRVRATQKQKADR